MIYYSFAADYSLSFDGTNDYVEVPFDASMNPAGDYSVNSWVKVSDLPNQWQSVVTSRSNNGTDKHKNIKIFFNILF